MLLRARSAARCFAAVNLLVLLSSGCYFKAAPVPEIPPGRPLRVFLTEGTSVALPESPARASFSLRPSAGVLDRRRFMAQVTDLLGTIRGVSIVGSAEAADVVIAIENASLGGGAKLFGYDLADRGDVLFSVDAPHAPKLRGTPFDALEPPHKWGGEPRVWSFHNRSSFGSFAKGFSDAIYGSMREHYRALVGE